MGPLRWVAGWVECSGQMQGHDDHIMECFMCFLPSPPATFLHGICRDSSLVIVNLCQLFARLNQYSAVPDDNFKNGATT